MIDVQSFRALPESERARRVQRLAEVALGDWDLPAVKLELLGIRENTAFLAHCGDGTRRFVKVHRPGYHGDVELESERLWMQALDRDGIRTPACIPTRSGRWLTRASVPDVPEERQVSVFEWVAGCQLGSIERGYDQPLDELEAQFRVVGALAARMHLHSAAWRPPASFRRMAWDVEGIVGDAPIWGRYWECEALGASDREICVAARRRLREELAAFGQGADRYGLIHADLLPENLLVDGDVVRLIDFDDAGFGWHLFDLATPLVYLYRHPWFGRIRDAMVDGYREHRPLPDEMVAHLPMFLAARATTQIGWIHTRSDSTAAIAIDIANLPSIVAVIEAYLTGDLA